MSQRPTSRFARLLCVVGASPLLWAAEGGAVSIDAAAETVAIALPAGAQGSLLVEIDGYDVTAVVRIDAGTLTLPARGLALAPGEHRLRVLAARDNGDIDTLLERTLEVAGPVAAGGYQTWDVLLGSGWRVTQHPDEDFAGVERGEHRATLQWSGERDGAAWALRGNASALYDSVTLNAPGGNVWQSPGYLLQAERRIGAGSVGLALGDDAIPLGNLLFSAYSRRGLRVDANALHDRVRLQAFTLNSEPETRLDADVVPASDTGSVQGGYAVVAPIAAHPEWLRVTSGYVSGDTTLGGVATSALDPITRYGGHAWNTALDSWAFGAALWLHAEIAQSDFDADGIQAGAPARGDDARQFSAQLSSGGALRLPGFDSWSLGYERQSVGPHFFSLGNLMLPGDLALEHGYLRAGTHGLLLSVDDTRMESDVDDDPARPRRLGKTRVLTASFTPESIDPSAGPWRVIGVPTLSAEWQDVDWRQREADAPLAGFDLDSRQRTRTLGLDLAHERVSLSLRHAESRYDDRSHALLVDDFEIYTPSPDTRETTWSAQLAWTAGDRLVLAPQVQSTTLRDLASHARSRNTLWGLQAQATLVPDRWWLQANYSETRDRPAPVDPFTPPTSFDSGGGVASLIYRAHRAAARTPDVDLQLSGQYGRVFEHDTWQVMLGFSLHWQKETP
jgi:hypothetical protein